MIVEDDPEMLDFLSRIVGEAGFFTVAVKDGLEAIDKMRRLKPDVAVLDLMLPKYGGLELLYELQRGSTAQVPLIIVTARYTGAADRAAIVKQPNVAVFFEKPVVPKELIDAVRGIVEKRPPH